MRQGRNSLFIQLIPFNVFAFPLTNAHHCIILKFAVRSLKATIRLTDFACTVRVTVAHTVIRLIAGFFQQVPGRPIPQ